MPNRRSQALVLLTALLLVVGVVLSAPDGSADARPGRRTSAPPPTAQTSGLDQVLGDQSRPNIVVIMADDMRADELQYMPRTQLLLAEQGVRFVNSFSPHPQCCPARASFLTGDYTHNHEVWTNRGDYGGFQAFDDTSTMPVALQRVGYDTSFLGKYLNGYGYMLLDDGTKSETYIPPGWSDWRAAARGVYRYFSAALNINGTIRPNVGWYQTRMLGAETEDVVGQLARSPRPFFVWASYVAPHVGRPTEKDDPSPVRRVDGRKRIFRSPAVPVDVRGMFDESIDEAPGEDGETDVSDKPHFIADMVPADVSEHAAMAEVTRQRAESLEVLDQEVEHTVKALERSGELDDTIVVFTADNGFFLGEHRLRAGKLLPYDPSLRVPLLVRGPGIPAGEVREDPVLMIDFAPTFLELAGARPDPTMDGSSFLDLDRPDPTEDTGWVRGFLTETGPRPLESTTEDGVLPPGADPIRFTQGVRTRRYLYVEHATGERELYDQRRDPEQLRNIVDRPAGEPVVAKLAAFLDQMRDCAGEECRPPTRPAPRR
ncbi:MAG: Choline-sulfatase [uncultured Nocardioidaceae bacterium]|uniref:Choline-sulfatase n=1 Tax=uncultured Nocardioidaceae bacterium TaxID=253824 RepID=A0A6J4LFK8_9ACTN|nr:MAG: Choline-sulfatase [uncultured Nocardioidaceae bacterium]